MRGLTRRHAAVTLAGLVAAAAIAAAGPATAPKQPPPPPKPDAVVSIRADLERAENLIELLIPFLAKLDFAETRRRTFATSGLVSVQFANLNGDWVWTAGRPNCVTVAYYAAHRAAPASGPSATGRAAAFQSRLTEFLDSLPTPRPRLHDGEADQKSWCH